MLLSNVETAKLLPAFFKTEVLLGFCEVIDGVVRRLNYRIEALPCENSQAALEACRDDELAQIAHDIGVLPYFPDLDRELRESLILQAKIWSRKAGTNKAIESTLNALFGTDTSQVFEHENYRYRVQTKGFVDADEISLKRFTSCLEAMGHVTCTPFEIGIKLEHELNQSLCAAGALGMYFEATIKG